MSQYRNRYRVESARLRDRDYSSPGYYFVTVCAYDRKELFGKIIADEMRLNEFGAIVMDEWRETGIKRPGIALDEFVVMPNHVHGIIRILGMNFHHSCRDVARNVSTNNEPNNFSVISPRSGSLSTIIRSFKSAVSKRIRASGFNGTVWQPRFHDHIIRDEKSLFQIRRYIRNNPMQWDADNENPLCKSPRYVAMPNPQKG